MQIGRDIPGCPGVTWLPSNARDMSSIPGPGTQILHSKSRSVVSDSSRPHRLYSPWNSPGQDTGVGSRHSLLWGIFPTQGSNPGLLHCRRILYKLSLQGSPNVMGQLSPWTITTEPSLPGTLTPQLESLHITIKEKPSSHKERSHMLQLRPNTAKKMWECLLSHFSHVRLCDAMDCSPPGSSVHGILQARMVEWVAMPSSSGSSQPGCQTRISQITGRFFTMWATREAPAK